MNTRALEASLRVAREVEEAINDNPFFVDNVAQDGANYFIFSADIEGEIKACLEAWEIDFEELTFMEHEIDYDFMFGIPSGMDKETYYNQYK